MIAAFLHRYYHTLPQLSVFLQDDGTAWTSLLTNLGALTPFELALWLQKALAAPYTSRELCLCDPIVEPNWRACPADPLPCYGVRRLAPGVSSDAKLPNQVKWTPPDGLWYDAQAWLLGGLAGLPVERWSTLRWAGGAQFAVRERDVRRHPRALYRRLKKLLGGVNDSHVPAFVPRELRELRGKEWAHIAERIWLALFDPEYEQHSAG